MAFVDLAPASAALLRGLGRVAPADFLAWAGVVVSGHPPARHVERVDGPDGLRFYLKKEHRVPWRERFASAWHGHGWASRSVREGRLLRQLRAAGVACPEVVAFGETGRDAFLLVRERPGLVELRAWLTPAGNHRDFARRLGRELARVHEAGFDHPDLYAKHVLVGDDEICIVDWQRSRQFRRVPWRVRFRDLAALDASLADSLASDRLRLTCLRSYLAASAGAPPLRRAAVAVRRRSQPLLTRRKVRDLRQPPLPAALQHLIPHDGERLCVTPALQDELHGPLPPELLRPPSPRAADAVERVPLVLPPSRPAVLIRRWRTMTTGRRPESLAATLFRLQRFGVAVPRVLALGQQTVAAQHYSFVLTDAPRTGPLLETFGANRLLRQAGHVLRRMHEAGYTSEPGRNPLACLGVVDGRVILTDATPLQRTASAGLDLAPVDLPRCFQDEPARWSRTDRLRLVLGYLGQRRADAAACRLLETVAGHTRGGPERQVWA